MNDLPLYTASTAAISDESRNEIRSNYGSRGERALAALDEGRVRRYLDFTVVISGSNEYVVEEEICTCGDFLFRGRECWHILAVRLAKTFGTFIEEPSWYQDRWKKGETDSA
jgi:predicted nucleic acid-binding Zn finger protein